jgi:hypothetical protein
MFRSRLQREIIFFLTFMVGLGAPAQVRGQKWSVQWEPVKVVNGSPVLFRVTAPLQLEELRGNFLGQEFSFRSSAACHCWYGFAGVNLATKPGTYTLHVDGKTKGGKDAEMSYAVAVGAAHYPTSTLKVAPGFVEPPKETLPRIEEDQVVKKKVFSTTAPETLCRDVLSRLPRRMSQACLDQRASLME